MSLPEKIVFYDGDCGFCNRSVQFILKNDRKGLIHFAALKSNFAKERMSLDQQQDLNTFYFLDHGKLYDRSSAGLRVANHLRFPINCLIVFWVVPKKWRDRIYNAIAIRRNKIFKEFCVLPKNHEINRFHD